MGSLDGAPAQTYAARLARLWYLSSKLPAGHPTLSIEHDLVSMAESVLKEHLLKGMRYAELLRARESLTRDIGDMVVSRMSDISGPDIKPWPEPIRRRLSGVFRTRA